MGQTKPSMKFDSLHRLIPYATGEKNHVVTMSTYNGVVLALPGRHQKDTSPEGGDFVVMVSDSELSWVNHQFTHDDIFADLESKRNADQELTEKFFKDYVSIVFGEDPAKKGWEERPEVWNDSVHPQTLLYSLQALAVAEHRRYHQHESRGGGRFLPARFASGIIEGLWTAEDCKKHQRRGRPGFDMMVKLFGAPKPLKKWNEDEE